MYEYPLIRHTTCTCTKGVPRNQFSSCMLFLLLEYNSFKWRLKINIYAWHLRSMSTDGSSSCQFNRHVREGRSSLVVCIFGNIRICTDAECQLAEERILNDHKETYVHRCSTSPDVEVNTSKFNYYTHVLLSNQEANQNWTTYNSLDIHLIFMSLKKKGHIVLHLSVGRSVGRSVCRTSNVHSMSFDPFA